MKETAGEVTYTRDEVVAQLEEIAKRNRLPLTGMLAVCDGANANDLDGIVEFHVLLGLLPVNDPLNVLPLDNGVAREDLSAAGWPPALVKATWDEFTYALGLRDGTRLWFAGADAICAADGLDTLTDWVKLRGASLTPPYFGAPTRDTTAFTFERGLEVRVSEIAWVCEAPHGS